MRAADVMTRDVLTVTADTKLADAVNIMLERRVSGLPVLDAEGEIVGILTEGDLLRRVEVGTGEKHRSRLLEFVLGPGREAEDYVTSHSRVVGDLMTRDVICVERDTQVSEVVGVMERKRLRRVPVVHRNKLIGIVSRADLLRAVYRALTGEPHPVADDAQIEKALRRELNHAHWLAAENIKFTAEEGVVTLEGTIFDERLRAALRVAAENVPGVCSVVDKLVTLTPTANAYYVAA